MSHPDLPRCLIIDPDAVFAGILSRIVGKHGFETRIIAEAMEGLRELRAHSYDLVLVDFSADIDSALILEEIRRDMPALVPRLVIVTTNPLVSSKVPIGVPVIGKSDLLPMMRYIET